MQITSRIIATGSVSRALGIIGDRWTLLILRDVFQGAHRFEELRALTGAARSTLTSRLNGLVDAGILKRVRYSDAPPRYEYWLSDQGLDLYGATLLIWRWEHIWAPADSGIPRYLRHKACGHGMKPLLSCSACGKEVTLDSTRYEIVKATEKRVSAPRPLFRRLSSVTSESHRGSNSAFVHVTDIMGDRWTPLVLSAAFYGLHRFDDIQSALEIATNILTHRLNYLVDHGIFERSLYSQHPPRYEYKLTKKGRDLYPTALSLMQWGDRWLAPASGANLRIFHKDCGAELVACVTCDYCHAAIGPHDVTFPPAARAQGPKKQLAK
ncbi:MAG TPA: helix-turn-helix domain-containing protein [Steroidobacter sp.]|uniref:winged helix-turn-helix transcriptional regulator n=1 Tax=Steroidobacter sp. TaxID=1978227 RepID=UPI002ED90394